MGWRSPTGWGPLDLSSRRRGVKRPHFLRFFDRCSAEWLWVDVLAMPEVLKDMPPALQAETEALRVGVINCFGDIVAGADHVVVLDSLLLRLGSRSPVDVAVVLALGNWRACLWTFVQARLAKKVVLKTQDSSFDLDDVIALLGKTVRNEDDRYYGLLRCLWPLRDKARTGVVWDTTAFLESVYMGCEGRLTDVEVDSARVLFPLFGVPWEQGWTLTDGFAKLVQEHPEEGVWIQRWCDYRGIKFKVGGGASQ